MHDDPSRAALYSTDSTASSAELDAMFASMPHAMYVVDAQGARRANQAGLDLFHAATLADLPMGADELEQRFDVRDAFTGLPMPAGKSPVARALKGELVNEEYMFRELVSGSIKRLRVAASPIRVAGQVTGVLLINEDITEQQRRVEAVQRSEESFRTLAEVMPQMVWTAHADGEIEFLNQRFYDYCALHKSQVTRALFRSMLHPDDVPQFGERWAHALATGEPFELELRLRRFDGVYRWHLSRGYGTRGASGRVIRWIGTSTDIDDAKRVSEELEKRTLFEQHLMGIVSHDLRNPLTAILMGANRLVKNELSAEQVIANARRIHASAERSLRMIRDLLDFTQTRLGGGIRVRRQPTNLYDLTSLVLEETEVGATEHRTELTRDGDAQGEWDSDRLAQVVTNLVTNALAYSPESSKVRVHIVGQPDFVELSVHNDGEPIASTQLARIFEPMRRASEQLNRTTRSVGLGLYIVDAIVRAHEGTVSVSSTDEAGSTFTVRLPRQASANMS